MQRLYSSYPSGTPGIALILLRLSLAALPFASSSSRTWLLASHALLFLMLAVAAALCAGIWTKLAALLALAMQVVLFCRLPQQGVILSLIFMMLCLSIAMLGAGCYSADGLLFGRKRVVLPPRQE
jgi:hypothetical protein